MTALRVLLGPAFVAICCTAAGELFLRPLDIFLPRVGRRFLHFTTGAMLMSAFVFALCALGQFRAAPLIGAGALLSGIWVIRCRPSFRPSLNIDLPTFWTALFWIPWAVFGALYFVSAMTPEISSDGTGYHLGLVYRYYEHHGFYRIGTLMYAGLYQGIEMLFLAAFAIGKHSAAALVHFFFLLLAPFGILAIARRAGEPRAGVLASMLFYLAPVVAKDATSAYIDTGTAVVLIASYLFLQVWRDFPYGRALIPAALLAGFAIACKITASSFFLYALFAVLTITAPWHLRLKRTLVLSSLALLPVLPWMVRNFLYFDNPFFPLLNRIFPNQYLYQIIEDELRRITAHYADVPWSQIPWEVAVGGKLAGIVGPVFFLAPVALLALRKRSGIQPLAAFVFVFLTYPLNTGGRFVIPSLPFLALAMAFAATQVPALSTALATTLILIHGLLSWPLTMNSWNKYFQWRIEGLDWRAALRIKPETQFFAERWPHYEPGVLLDRFVAPGELVLSPDMGQMAYQRREILGFSDSALGRRAFIVYSLSNVPALGNTYTRDMRIPTANTRSIRIVAASPLDTDLRISELRFFHDDREIPRKPSWRITASSNPCEAPLAFDNIGASFWTSGDKVYAPNTTSNWIGVDFGEQVSVNRIVVTQHADQRWMSLKPSLPVNGSWQIVQTTETGVETPTAPTVRVEAHDELWRLGFRWMLLPDTVYGATDLRDHPAEWGVLQAGMSNGFRLWKLTPPIVSR